MATQNNRDEPQRPDGSAGAAQKNSINATGVAQTKAALEDKKADEDRRYPSAIYKKKEDTGRSKGHGAAVVSRTVYKTLEQDGESQTGAGEKKSALKSALPKERKKSTDKPPIFRRYALVGAMGNMFYELGFATEYRVLQVWRVLRDVFFAIVQLIAWFFTTLLGWLGALVAGVWRDFTEPFRHLTHQKRQVERIRERARHFGIRQTEVPGLVKVQVKNSLRFISAIATILLPLAAVLVLIFTVHNVLTMQYALAVEINGKVLGYVADQTVVESAKSLLRDRIQLADNQEQTDWQLNPTYTIARASSYTTTQQLVNEILRSGSKNPGDIVQATGLYMGQGENRRLYAVTEDGEKLNQYLADYLALKQAEAPENATVSFVNGLECDPRSEDVFFSSSVLRWDKTLETLNENTAEGEEMTADGEDTLTKIALENNISAEQLLTRNPGFAELGEDGVPVQGETIVLKNPQPLLQVQSVFLVMDTEEIPFKTIESPNPDKAYGTRLPIQEGIAGSQEVWDNYSWVDNELQNKVRQDDLTNIITLPQDKIVEVGTNEQTKIAEGDYMFPVPSAVRGSRGMSAYHRGMDINTTTGDPIFAVQSGKIIAAGWHFSYGYHVVIDHGNGMVSLYGHCSQLYVEAGTYVEQGALIGAIGSTGNSSGPHCHLEFILNGQLVNPQDYLTLPPGYRQGNG